MLETKTSNKTLDKASESAGNSETEKVKVELEQVKQNQNGITTVTTELNKRTAELAAKQDEILQKIIELNTSKAASVSRIRAMDDTRSESDGPFSHYDSQRELEEHKQSKSSLRPFFNSESRKSIGKNPNRDVLRSTGTMMLRNAAIKEYKEYREEYNLPQVQS